MDGFPQGIMTGVKQRSLIDRTLTRETGLRKHFLFSLLQELPYGLFNGEDKIFAYFSVKEEDKKRNIVIIPNHQSYEIKDINLSCTEHFDDNIQQFFYTLNKEGFENVKIYDKRPAIESLLFG
ncbi:MAG: hypothetical protein AABW56_01205 [Nanoarchaeota archaeon]